MIYIFIGMMALISLLAATLCKGVFRPEDSERLDLPSFKLVSLSKPFKIITWFMAALLSIILFVYRQDPDGLVPLGFVSIVVTGMCMMVGFFQRDCYYTDDGERLTYVKHLNVVWSLPWEEINHVYRRLVGTGESVAVYYDIVTKDGEVIKGLPPVMGRTLRINKKLENYHTVPFVPVLIGIIFLVAILMLIFG